VALTETAQWPDGYRSCVMLAFDVDGPSGGAMVDGSIWQMPRYFVQGSYGPFRAVPRILDLLERLGVRATFFVPAWVVEHWPAVCRDILVSGHEVGHHGYKHERYADLDVAAQESVLQRSQAVFEDVLGMQALGYRTPTGDWQRETPRVLAEHGFLYSSSFRDDDRPYRRVINGAVSSLVEIPAPVELDDYAYYAFTEDPPFPKGHDRIAGYRVVLSNWCQEFDGMHRAGGLLTTTFHPKISATPGRAVVLERFVEHMLAAEGSWFATGTEVARWVLAHPEQFAVRGETTWDGGVTVGS
jgi:peptidoglycan-N-acetylglucosamine deacetylase